MFLIGCVVTFVGLAGALILAQQAGQAVGWGFQLQSPTVVAALAVLMLAIGLNLSGVFEIGLSVQGAGSGLATQGGLVGAFFTGVLAVVVAAPCTAPFMAGAIGWAFTQPPLQALSVFVALGLGLAAPFTLVSLVPGLFKRLPRPGAWMEAFKKTLAFPMYAAAAWCVTCQVNERTALATAGVADAFRRTKAAYLRADWTNRNAEIADTLKARGRAGVPLYLVYDAKGGEPQELPQILTEGGVVQALNSAAGS